MKKLTLVEKHDNLSLVQPKSKSKQKDMGESQASTPVSSMNRNSSHTILRTFKQEDKQS